MADEKDMQEQEEKPVSPEMENVEANKPDADDEKSEESSEPVEHEEGSTEPSEAGKGADELKPAAPEEPKAESVEKPESKTEDKPKAPTKIGKEKSKQKSNANFLITLGLIFVGLFILFVVLMVLVVARGGSDSAILGTLGLDASGIKQFLLLIINLSFGFLAFLFFVLLVIGVFRLLFAKKGDKDAKRRGIKTTLLSFFPLAFVLVIWLMLFNFIGGIVIEAERVVAEIVILEPTDLTGLSAPLEVTFSSENAVVAIQNTGVRITGVRWDFDGDGVFDNEPTDFEVVYLYNRRGNFNVGLQVDVEGEEQPRTFNYPLTIGEALFSATPATGTAPLEVRFDASGLVPDDRRIASFDWDFENDGTYELTGKDNESARFTFDKIGVYRVHLRMIDERNLVENYYRDIEIVPGDRPPLAAEITASPGLSGTVPFQIRFDGGESVSEKGQIEKYEWDFGDGSQLQQGRSVTHIFNDAAFYTVRLTVTDSNGDEATTTVEVDARGITSEPEAVISTDPAVDAEGMVVGDIPFKVEFDASGSTDADGDIVDYEWDFDTDSATAVGQKVDYTFEAEGTYDVQLLVRDATDQESTVTITVVVQKPGLRAEISAEPSEGTVPLTVQFDGSGSSAFEGNIVSYEWDFGDGSAPSITGAQIGHKYDQVGTYTVTLKVVTDDNQMAESTRQVFVREVPLTACFEPSRTHGPAPVSITFDSACSTGAVLGYNWDFGDGDTSDNRSPAHTFEEPGTYNVTLEVSDDKNNVDTFNMVVVSEGDVE